MAVEFKDPETELSEKTVFQFLDLAHDLSLASTGFLWSRLSGLQCGLPRQPAHDAAYTGGHNTAHQPLENRGLNPSR